MSDINKCAAVRTFPGATIDTIKLKLSKYKSINHILRTGYTNDLSIISPWQICKQNIKILSLLAGTTVLFAHSLGTNCLDLKTTTVNLNFVNIVNESKKKM